MNANNENSLKLSFWDIAQQVLRHYSSTNVLVNMDLNANLDQVVDLAKAWLDLSMNTHWLMVYDNYNNLKVFGSLDDSAVDLR